MVWELLRKTPDGQGAGQRRLLGGALKPGKPAGEDGEGRALHPEDLACDKVWDTGS